jgi:hypothetical protein
MSIVKLNEEEVREMRSFYQEELHRTKRKLEHLESMLQKLTKGEKSADTSDAIASQEGEVPQKRKRRKKRGPKPIWGAFILKRLRQLEKPVTYEELIDDAMIFFKADESKRKKIRQSIINSAFRLRTIQGKINTHSVKGKREVYVGLRKWFDEDGNLLPEYARRINA